MGSTPDDLRVAGKVPKKLKRDCHTPEKALGAVITELRLATGLSTHELCSKVRCDPSYMNGIEQGTQNPAFEILKAIADFHQIKLSVLIARAERKHENCKKKRS
jgi:transcriptional regulator with XRE-family HTH domain